MTKRSPLLPHHSKLYLIKVSTLLQKRSLRESQKDKELAKIGSLDILKKRLHFLIVRNK